MTTVKCSRCYASVPVGQDLGCKSMFCPMKPGTVAAPVQAERVVAVDERPESELPTIEKVREHAERYPVAGGGRWRCNRSTGAVLFEILRAFDGRVQVYHYTASFIGWADLACDGCCDWTPCDQAGNPLPLVQALQRAEAAELAALAECDEWRAQHDIVVDELAGARSARATLTSMLGDRAAMGVIQGVKSLFATDAKWREHMLSVLRDLGALIADEDEAMTDPHWPDWAVRTIRSLIARRSGFETIDYTRWASEQLRADAAEQERDGARVRAEIAEGTSGILRKELEAAKRSWAADFDAWKQAEETIVALRAGRDAASARAESFHQALQRSEDAWYAALAEADEWRARHDIVVEEREAAREQLERERIGARRAAARLKAWEANVCKVAGLLSALGVAVKADDLEDADKLSAALESALARADNATTNYEYAAKERDKYRRRLTEVEHLLGEHGCGCECDHHHDEHADDCERCLACRIEAIVAGRALMPGGG